MQSQLPASLSPLTTEQSQQMQALLTTLTAVQQAWVSGYLAATANGAAAAVVPQAEAPEAATLTVLYGSQTGNAKHVAQDLADGAKARGLDARLINMADYKPNQLKAEKYLAIVVSTYGEGEPPESAQKLYDFVGSKKAPKLDGAKIAVLGLGDTSYEFFCQTAVDFEERLTKLGATVALGRALLDVDFEEQANAWIDDALDVLEPELKAEGALQSNVVPMVPGVMAAPAVPTFTKKNPFVAEIGAVQKITGRDSVKDVRHVEILLDGSGLTYRPGDSLGVYFQNDSAEVDALLERVGLEPTIQVEVQGELKTIREALIEDLELTQSYPGFVVAYAEATGNATLMSLAGDKTALRDYLADRQIFDVLREYPANIEPQALVDALRKQQPRLYSIASSQSEVDEEVHLTVGVVEYEAGGVSHLGGCSGFLGRRVEEGGEVRVFVEENDTFRLPDHGETPIIMVGPGTGIAPFRAFLQERDAAGHQGDSWLFFGNPNFTQDFLYQVELQSYLKSGILTKLDVAFSRDQAEKLYVQHRLLERGAEVFAWLERGAHFYICGDGSRMAKDVHTALVEIVSTHGAMSDQAAEEYLTRLRDTRRLQRDVY